MGIMNVIRADLTDANLSGAQMFGLVTSSGMETSRKEAPILVRANLSGARVLKAPLIFKQHRTSRGKPAVLPACARTVRPGAVGDVLAWWG